MIPFDAHFLSFVIRWVHVVAMALLLGGAGLMWGLSIQTRTPPQSEPQHALLIVAEFYELIFWLAIGLLVMTGVGNLGAFGEALPGPNTTWGQKLTIKLLVVLVFVLLSLIRTLLIVRVSAIGSDTLTMPLSSVCLRLYASTTLFATVILFVAVALAHS
jgi:hypothetical protein